MCGSGLDAPSLLRGVAAIVAGVVGYDGAFWATADPATLLITGAYVEALPAESAAPFYENEYLHDDVNKFSQLARGIRPVATLSEATGGDLSRGRIHREVGRQFGFPGDSLKAAFMAGPSCWGVAALARRDPRAFFIQADLSFMASIGSHVGEGLRAAVLLDALAPPASESGPGLLLLDHADQVTATSAAAQEWLAELSGDYRLEAGTRVPAAVLAVAATARNHFLETSPGGPARARVRTRAGRWLVLHGVSLASGASGATAVIIEQARAPEVAPIIVEAYGLSPREREVVQQVLLGASTADIAGALHISPYTVQDHLKVAFEKIGVRSRGEMVKAIFDRHGTHRGPRRT
jgi:DNA-binding CsgD family transcriptional regulator